MGRGTLTIYSASAGSGKTYRLTAIYLGHLFRSRYQYRKILAVTFTNKATAEMKNRILDQLYLLSGGYESEYLKELIEETGMDEQSIRKESSEILFSILHDFSRFSVSTIDTFFQRVLRAFTREIGLNSGFTVELDHDLILSSAVEDMISSSADDPILRKWLISFVMANLAEEKSWDLRRDIIKLAEELFREKYRVFSDEGKNRTEDKELLLQYITKLHIIRKEFERKLTEIGSRCLHIFSENALTDDMFYYKGSGIPKFIRNLAEGNVGKAKPGSYVRKIFEDPPVWSSGKPSPQLVTALNNGLERYLKEAVSYYDVNIISYISSGVILENIYALGILEDVLKIIHQTASSENIFLLSEAGQVLKQITKEDQAPFIYEKIGNIYENYMIDEFQDTSLLQWENIKPLTDESMAQGFDNLVVGDLKQSIYRWRNSDWDILANMKDNLVDGKRYLSEPLLTNWRSRSNIIRFNNTLFSVIPGQIQEELSETDLSNNFKHLYSEVIQEDPGKGKGGFIRLEFIDNDKSNRNPDEDDTDKIRGWKAKVLDKLPRIIETFQDKGYRASDIGIIVRDSKDGEAVVRRMIDYRTECEVDKKERYNYNIVSNDSLLLSGSHVLSFIISVLRFINNPADMISRALMVRYHSLAVGKEDVDKIPLSVEWLGKNMSSVFPEDYESFISAAGQLPLFELTESIIEFFKLGEYPANVAYLNAFQDIVLGFTGSKGTDIASFLEWWESAGKSSSVVLPANQDAARVFTIHKSKGLEFKIVILPFISWNLDHKNLHQPFLWVKPGTEPFNEPGVVPIRYSSTLAETIFAEDYYREKFAVYTDNVNLLYVAMTRAIDAIWGFAPDPPSRAEKIAEVLKNAITSDTNPAGDKGVVLSNCYNVDNKIFEYGEIPAGKEYIKETPDLISHKYSVNRKPSSLRLKLHGENYFSQEEKDKREKISYGKLMHSVFENIDTVNDIPEAVRQMELEGRITHEEACTLERKLETLISESRASEWFRPGLNVIKEAEILLPSGQTRRPDRIITEGDNAVIIDFKFGEENENYKYQLSGYRKLLSDMGYQNIKGYLWYVDIDKIVEA